MQLLTCSQQLELLKLRHKSMALLREIKAYAKKQIQQEDFVAVLSVIYQAMQRSGEVMKHSADDHRLIFMAQMQRIGGHTIYRDEPYLRGILAQVRLEYVQRLESLFDRLEAQRHRKAEEPAVFSVVEVSAALLEEKVKAQRALDQHLDEARQRSNGVRQYRWITMRDGKVRPSHAALDGQVFLWEEAGSKPGQEFGCRCSAEPVTITDPPIEPVYPELALIPLLRLERAAAAIISGVRKRLDKVDQKPEGKPKQPIDSTAKKDAEKIANGHAYNKHMQQRKEFPEIKTREEFKKHVEDIMNHPTEMKPLERGRTGYWDNKTGTVVIQDPSSADGGTVFRPQNGKYYFDNLA